MALTHVLLGPLTVADTVATLVAVSGSHREHVFPLLPQSLSVRFALVMPLMQNMSSSLKTLAVFAGGFYFLAALYLTKASSRDPSSAFFQPNTAFEPNYSTIRQRQAEAFIGNATENSRTAKSEPRLCVGIASVQRDERYFRTAVGSLLEGLDRKERDEIHLVTLIANSSPQEHPAFNEAWLERLSDQVLTYRDVPE